jgi:hypothetical protein
MTNAPDTDPQDKPTRLGSLLYVVRILLDYGRHMAETVVRRSKKPSFASIAVGFGTADLPFIMASLERGILRATALLRVLEARLAAGRDVRPVSPPGYGPLPEPRATRANRSTTRRKSLPWNDLRSPLTVEEMEVRIRRRPIGRTIVDICLDLAVLQFDQEFWNHLFDAVYWYRGNFGRWQREEHRRYRTFDHERNHKPINGWWEWWEPKKQRLREALGFLPGEPPVLPSDLLLLPAPP